MCGSYSPSNVISTSYSSDEFTLGAHAVTRQCYEYMKLGLAGVTSIFSSGDSGVAGSFDQCQSGTSQSYGREVLLEGSSQPSHQAARMFIYTLMACKN